MFYILLLVTFLVSLGISVITVRLFDKPIAQILNRIIADDLGVAWHRYITFAAYVVGISGGVRLYELEQYVSARHKDTEILALTGETWTLEVYRTVIGTLQSIAWMLLVVFVIALVAFVIVRAFELRRPKSPVPNPDGDAQSGS